MNISTLRQYRINLEPNKKANGIAVFDLVITFFIAYLLESYLTTFFKITKKKYYLSIIPLAILSHILFRQETFLNTQLMNNYVNIYKILLLIILYYLIK